MLVKSIKVFQKKKKTKSENSVANAIKISETRKYYEIQKINKNSFNKVSVSNYKSKNLVILELSRLQCLAMRVVEIGAILGYRAIWGVWNKIHWICLLGDVEGNIVSHYFFLIISGWSRLLQSLLQSTSLKMSLKALF